ncbi:MAG: type II/IV secretion system ATPase subunit [Candidatus Methanomethylophilus sp.]|nr:type II/IV secretion system ATPase subunit [Methanomethylophilus sp.]
MFSARKKRQNFVQQNGPVFVGTDNIPPSSPPVPQSSFREDLKTVIGTGLRTKPRYAECWLVGNVGQLDIIEEYDTPNGHVVIGTASDGETEYNLLPTEYTCSDTVNSVIENSIEEIRRGFRKSGAYTDRFRMNLAVRDVLSADSDTLLMACGGNAQAAEGLASNICDIVYRYTVGLGVFDVLLDDPRLEDIYVDAPCDKNRIHVTLSGIMGGNSHLRCRTNLVVERREIMNLICALKRMSGLPYCESNPVLETDMRDGNARATVIGYPLSPNGDAVSIRKHSSDPWTITRLIANGTIDAYTAGLLSFLVQNRATLLICGARGAGKSSLLSAMMLEFDKSTRILTIEDTRELPTQQMRSLGYKVQSMVVDDHMDGDSLSRANEALRVSLRMGESAIILGEVRGEEAKTLYESMRTGRAGSSIMGTIHGDSAKSVFDRVVHDLGIQPEAFMATEVLVTVGTFADRATGAQSRRISEIAATSDRVGKFTEMSGTKAMFQTPVMRRISSNTGMSQKEIENDIEARAQLRRILAESGKNDPQYLEPEWIGIANSYLDRNAGKEADVIAAGFRDKYGLRPDTEPADS